MGAELKTLDLDDIDVVEMAINAYGAKNLKKNYYGVPGDPEGPPVSLADWNADGLAGMIQDYKDQVKKNGGGEEGVIKTLTAGSATVGYFIPTVIMPGVIDVARRKFPLLTATPKTPAIGKTVNINKRTTRQTPEWGAGDGATLAVQDQVAVPVTADQAYLYMAGSVAGPALKLTEKTINLYVFETQKHLLDLMFYKEQVFFRGDENAGSNIASVMDLSAESTKFTGLMPALEDAGATYFTDLAAARKIYISDIINHHELIEDRGGNPGATYVDRNTYSYVRKQAQAALVIDPDTPKFGFGLREFNIESVPVIWSPGLVSTANQRAAVTVDFRAFGEYPLLPIQHVNVAQQRADKQEFFYRNYSTFKLVAFEWCQATWDGK